MACVGGLKEPHRQTHLGAVVVMTGVSNLTVQPPSLQVVSYPFPSTCVFPLPSSDKSVIKIFKNWRVCNKV